MIPKQKQQQKFKNKYIKKLTIAKAAGLLASC